MRRLTLLSLAALVACSDPSAPAADLALADSAPGDGSLERATDGQAADASLRCEPGAALLARVDPARMKQDLVFLTGLKERRSQAAQQQAIAYVKSQLTAAGLAPRELPYTYKGGSYANLEATVAGSDSSAKVLIVGAHVDSTSNDAQQIGRASCRERVLCVV